MGNKGVGFLLRGGATGGGDLGGGGGGCGCGDGMGNVSGGKLTNKATHAAHCVRMPMQERTATAEGVGGWRETRGSGHRT